jgi:hypothetical protein
MHNKIIFAFFQAEETVLKDPFSKVLKFALDQQKMNFKELDASSAKLFTRYQSNVSQLKKALKQPGTMNTQRLYQVGHSILSELLT